MGDLIFLERAPAPINIDFNGVFWPEMANNWDIRLFPGPDTEILTDARKHNAYEIVLLIDACIYRNLKIIFVIALEILFQNRNTICHCRTALFACVRTLDEFDALFIALHDVEAIARRIPGSGLWLAAPPARIPRTSPLRTARSSAGCAPESSAAGTCCPPACSSSHQPYPDVIRQFGRFDQSEWQSTPL
jgi:hypothetical protein